MMIAVKPSGEICGYFLDSQLAGADPLDAVRQTYGCTDASAVHSIPADTHRQIFNEIIPAGGGVYWDDSIVARPLQATRVSKQSIRDDGQDELVIQGLPENAEVFVNDEPMGVVSGGSVSLVFDSPGTFHLRSVIWPFLDFNTVVEAG